MIRELSQGNFLIKRRIRIFENRVVYYESKFANGNEITITYEDLTNFKEMYTATTQHLIWGVVVSALIFAGSFALRNDKEFDNPYMWIFCGAAFLAVSAFYLMTREKVWKIKLQNYTFIFIKRNAPDKTTVDDFIEDLFRVRKEYLRDTYLYIDKNIQYEPQLKNLQWLKKVDAISKDEFEIKRLELSDLFNTEKKSIGFSNR